MRILIVDDHPIVASGCRAVLADEGEIEILEAADAEDGECVFIVERPDLSIIDINLPTVWIASTRSSGSPVLET